MRLNLPDWKDISEFMMNYWPTKLRVDVIVPSVGGLDSGNAAVLNKYYPGHLRRQMPCAGDIGQYQIFNRQSI